MNYNISTPSPGNVITPLGWKAEWSPEYARYFYVNINTKESTWVLPAAPPPLQQPQRLPQRKPVPTQLSQPQPQPQPQIIAPVAQRAFVESYATQPPQISTGYFPTVQSPTIQPQPQYVQSPAPSHQQNPQQQFPQAPQQQLSYTQSPAPVQPLPQQQHAPVHVPQPQYSQLPIAVQTEPSLQQHKQPPQQQYPQPHQYAQQQPYPTPPASGGQQYSPFPIPGQQGQQNNFGPGIATPNSNHMSLVNQQQYPQLQQTFSPPATPISPNPQQPMYTPMNTNPNARLASPQGNVLYSVPQQHGFQGQPQPQPQYQPIQPQHQSQSHPQYAMQQPQRQAQQPPNQVQPNRRTSMVGSSLMGGSMMNKMSSKFTQLQKGVSGAPPTAANSNGKAPADWKKWAKRGAIGVAGIGALALGVDAAGDMFSGAEALGGGGDFSGGGDMFGGGEDFSGGGEDFSGGGYDGGGDAAAAMDAQTAVDASNAQLGMEQMGQENAMMLTDPVGTEYTAAATDAQVNDFTYSLV
ncbi:hypothetical protein CC86DRAFT_462701 [Ophiobolus disseminans]|uniref:WW domain-containing protein n=1 Tax=Ophiobolus disseminans TaxID=1469910 RepID=A0A6A7AGY2_9PLEO|nr:hypothetical protein CC86DRAFT_462701 [Ophiobolus disseminans]